MMATKQSFSRSRKWSIAFQVGLIVFVIFSIVVMLNYLSSAYFHRFHLSTTLKNELSPLTVRLVRSLTNDVKVTIYYDRDDPFFTTIKSLLREYHDLNAKISVESVDYLRNPLAAQRVKTQFKQVVFPTTTNLVIFESGGRPLLLDGNALAKYTLEQIPNEREQVYQRRAVAFEGERMFTSALLKLANPNPLYAYFLEGHGEQSVLINDTNTGFSTFVNLVKQNLILPVQIFSLLGSNSLPDPAQCSLLVIAGPDKPLNETELDKIDRYLGQGGRLLALFKSNTRRDSGLERLMRKWGVDVSKGVIKDPAHSTDAAQAVDVVTSTFTPHPVTSGLIAQDWSMEFYNPRPVAKIQTKEFPAETLKVQEIVLTSPDAFLEGEEGRKGVFPLVVAVEKGDTKGIVSGSTRIIAAGDSLFLGNQLIEYAANRDFAGFALNWLLDRPQLLEGIGQRGIARNQLLVPARQMVRAQWVLLGAMPGTALLLGGLVWVRRRK